MRTLLAIILFLFPVLAAAAPSILVNAVPTGATLFDYSKVEVPFPDLEKAASGEVEAGLASAIAGVIPFAEQNGVTHICLLSAAGENGRSYAIVGAQAKLHLQAKNASFVIVLYRGGGNAPAPLTYSLAKPDSNRKSASMSIKKVEVPDGWNAEAWLYFNLPKIQAEAAKVGAAQVFLQTSGTGPASPVIIPGVKEPLMVFPDQTILSATWYIGNETRPLPR